MTTEVEKRKLEILDGIAEKFMALKSHVMRLGINDADNLRLAIERFDDGFLRIREAVFNHDKDKAEAANKE